VSAVEFAEAASWLPSVGQRGVLRRNSGYMSKTAAWY
jgi:hypothetical protein